jgi:hypothetical protein
MNLIEEFSFLLRTDWSEDHQMASNPTFQPLAGQHSILHHTTTMLAQNL